MGKINLRTPLPADASAAAQADAHAALLDTLGIAQAVMFGASAGAPSAMQFALRHAARCRALVLVVPAAYVPHPDGAPSLRSPSRTPLLFDALLRSDFLFWAASRLCRDTFIGSILGTPPAVVHEASAAEQARRGSSTICFRSRYDGRASSMTPRSSRRSSATTSADRRANACDQRGR